MTEYPFPGLAAAHTVEYVPVNDGLSRVQIRFNQRSPELDDVLQLAGHLVEFLADRNLHFKIQNICASDSLLSLEEHPDLRTCYLEGVERGRRYVAFVLNTGFVGDGGSLMPVAYVESQSHDWQETPLLNAALLSAYARKLNRRVDYEGGTAPTIAWVQ